MSEAFRAFKKTIPECHCHCRECCKCDQPIHNISISKEMADKLTPKQFWEVVNMMSIPGANNIHRIEK